MPLPLEKALNSLFQRCGSRGIYQGREVLFLLSEPDEIVGIGFVRAQSPGLILKVRYSEVPELKIGDDISYNASVYNVMSEPRRSINGLVWEAECSLG